MAYRIAAGLVLLLHLGFILFVVFGGLAVARRRWLALLHLPVAAWGFLVEVTGWGCPLTYLENYFLVRAGASGYTDDFISHYLLRLMYPVGLTRQAQLVLGVAVVLINAAIYAWALRRRPAHARRRGK